MKLQYESRFHITHNLQQLFSVLHNHLYSLCFSAKVLSVFVSVILPEQNKASCFYMQMTANLVTCLLSEVDFEFTFQPKITCFEMRKWKDVQREPCTFVICFLLLSPPPVCAADPLLCLPCIHIYNHATLPPFFPPQVPASLDRRAGDLPDQPSCDSADIFQLCPAATVSHLLPTREWPASAGCCLPLWVSSFRSSGCKSSCSVIIHSTCIQQSYI